MYKKRTNVPLSFINLSDIGQTLKNKLYLDFLGGNFLLFHVVDILFSMFLWVNSSKAKYNFSSINFKIYFLGYQRGLKIPNQLSK
jgi:hypothetical protein